MRADKVFRNLFSCECESLARAPGRLEVLGNHTDYNEGFVLSAAVDCYTYVAVGKSKDSQWHLFSSTLPDGIRRFTLHDIHTPLPGGEWTNYIGAITSELMKRGHPITPFRLVVSSTVPLAAGMGSSAALEMAVLTALCDLFDINLSMMEKAKIGQSCENNYLGANTGLMDQFTCLYGQKNHLILSEYRQLSITTVPFPEDLVIVVFNSGVKHDLSQEYNERRDQCQQAVNVLRQFDPTVEALRDMTTPTLMQHKDDLPAKAFKRALHVISENKRVHEALNFLKEKETTKFAQLLFESHQSSIDNFENSCEELNFLVEVAQRSPLCLGARLSGGGFGGVSIHLVKKGDSAAYRQWLNSEFKNKFGSLSGSFTCTCAAGAALLTASQLEW